MIDLTSTTFTLLLGRQVAQMVTTPPLTKKAERDKFVKNNSLFYFRQQLKATRKERGYSRAVMAQCLGVSLPRYTKIESGRSDLSLNTIVKIANLFNCGVEVSMVGFSTLCEHQLQPKTDSLPMYNEECSGCERDLAGLNAEIERRNRIEREGRDAEPRQIEQSETLRKVLASEQRILDDEKKIMRMTEELYGKKKIR
jgi:transcriptional regulator with XRE-family HTH domain